MSQRALNERLFHGTASAIPVGDRIVSATRGGQTSHWDETGSHNGQASRDHAFATTSEDTAWYFAQHASSRLPDTWSSNRARVYEVAPNPRMKAGVHPELKEYIAPSFKTTTVHDTKPGQQGTFPEINWNRHIPGGRSFGHDDANHPTTNPTHSLAPAGRVYADNQAASQQQDAAHMAFKSRIESIGQTALFDYDHKSTKHADYSRAQSHDMRHVVNQGAPRHQIEPEMVEAQSMDAYNARKGRRTNIAKRTRQEITYGGAL